MSRRAAIRLIFIGLAIMLASWWAVDDHRLVNALHRADAPDLIYDPIDLLIDDMKLGFLVGGLVALFGAYRAFAAGSNKP